MVIRLCRRPQPGVVSVASVELRVRVGHSRRPARGPRTARSAVPSTSLNLWSLVSAGVVNRRSSVTEATLAAAASAMEAGATTMDAAACTRDVEWSPRTEKDAREFK